MKIDKWRNYLRIKHVIVGSYTILFTYNFYYCYHMGWSNSPETIKNKIVKTELNKIHTKMELRKFKRTGKYNMGSVLKLLQNMQTNYMDKNVLNFQNDKILFGIYTEMITLYHFRKEGILPTRLFAEKIQHFEKIIANCLAWIRFHRKMIPVKLLWK